MAGVVSTRVLTVVLLATGLAAAQERRLDSLPDAPSAQTVSPVQSSEISSFRQALDATHSPVTNVEPANGLQFDPGHLRELVDQKEPIGKKSDPVAKLFAPATSSRSAKSPASTRNTLVGRAKDAATSAVMTHDETGRKKLNTPYLLRVLTAAAADSAHTPYWRRSLSQPASDVGSTIGNDAGMKVFHEFEPGIMQVMKRLEPKFVSQLGQRITNNKPPTGISR